MKPGTVEEWGIVIEVPCVSCGAGPMQTCVVKVATSKRYGLPNVVPHEHRITLSRFKRGYHDDNPYMIDQANRIIRVLTERGIET